MGCFFEGEGEKSWALFLMRSVCVFHYVAWFWVKIKDGGVV